MPPLAGIVNLTDDPSVDLRIAENLGGAMGQSFAAIKIAKQEKLRQTADAEFVRVLNDSRQKGLSPEQILTEIYKVPNYTQSKLAQDYAKTQELYTQQNDLKEEQYRNQEQVNQLKSENQYNLLSAKYDWMLQNNLLTNEQKSQFSEALERLRQAGRIDLAGQRIEGQTQLQTQKDTAAGERTQANITSRENIAGENIISRENIASQKPNILSDADGNKYTFDNATGIAKQVPGMRGKQDTEQLSPASITTELRDISSEIELFGQLIASTGKPYQPTKTQLENLQLRANRIGYAIEAVELTPPIYDQRNWLGMKREKPIEETPGTYGYKLVKNKGQTPQAASPQEGWGNRLDGTPKGMGYFGELQRPDGKVSTELSIGVEFDGKETQIPSLVPTLNEDEKDYLLQGGKPTKAIIQKAIDHAKKRIEAGKSPFAQEGEQPSGGPSPRAPFEEGGGMAQQKYVSLVGPDEQKGRILAPKPGEVIIEKDGVFGYIPESQAEEAMMQGYGVYR